MYFIVRLCMNYEYYKGPSIKDVRTQASGLSSADIMRTGEGFRCGRPHFLMQKNFGFFEIYGVSARTWGKESSQCGHFSDEGVNFSRFCANVLYGLLRNQN